MPKGPQGQKRPADAVGLAVLIGRIATGEVEDAVEAPKATRAEIASKGGRARAVVVPARKRVAIARKAAKARYPATPADAEPKTD